VPKPLLSEESEKLDPPILDELISRISTLASVYHKPPAMFVRLAKQRLGQNSDEEEEVRNREEPESLLPPTGDLLGGGDLLGSTSSTPEVALPQLLSPQAENANGLQVNGKFFVNGENIELRLQITNHSGKVISGFLVKFKKNLFNLEPATPNLSIQSISPGQTVLSPLPCTYGKLAAGLAMSPIDVALKTNDLVVYFSVELPLPLLLSPDGRQDKTAYISGWQSIQKESYFEIVNVNVGSSISDIQAKLEANRIFYITHRNIKDKDYVYLSAKTIDGSIFLLEISQLGNPTWTLCVKSISEPVVPLLAQAVQSFLSS